MNDRSSIRRAFPAGVVSRDGPRAAASTRRRSPRCARCWADAPRERSLLIEHLHRIQDAKGCLAPAHIVALAQEMKLATTEVYEVATFYHHFDVLADGEAAPPPVTIRVCETLSCQMAGADALHDALLAGRAPVSG